MNPTVTTPDQAKSYEMALQRALLAWIVTGLAFMLLPGTFLGAWNLIAISGGRGAAPIAPEWIQAHGHAQIFGWIASFILGIGFYSLSKMSGLGRFAVRRAWTSWGLWTAGVLLRWLTNLYSWEWRLMLPLSAGLEFTAFLIFFFTVARHRAPRESSESKDKRSVWMFVVVISTVGFLASLSVNMAVAVRSAIANSGVAIEHDLDQRLLPLYTWGFPVLAIWGFSARWLPVFLGRPDPSNRLLLIAVAMNVAAVAAALAASFHLATLVASVAAVLSVIALRIFHTPERPPKIKGVHSSFPLFVQIAYIWLLISAVLGISAASWDVAGGLWGSSRHALTVGFISTMVFAIGQRVLPAFCGMHVLFSPRLMFASLFLLNVGCALRVGSEISAYEAYAPAMWALLPVSAVIEMAAVSLFAVSLIASFTQAPPHVQQA
jgi:uncharacterized protein involved in response to NO